jgi:quercetin dioxygenase-like cupin family protein
MTGVDNGRARGRDSLLGSRIPAAFTARRVVVAAGAVRPYEEAEWLDAIVVVERGEIELECSRGSCRRFRRGDVLWLAGLPLRALHNCGRENAVLLAVSRRAPMSFPPSPGLKGNDHSKRSVSESETEMIHETKEPR